MQVGSLGKPQTLNSPRAQKGQGRVDDSNIQNWDAHGMCSSPGVPEYRFKRAAHTIDIEIILIDDPNGMFQDKNIMGHPPLF